MIKSILSLASLSIGTTPTSEDSKSRCTSPALSSSEGTESRSIISADAPSPSANIDKVAETIPETQVGVSKVAKAEQQVTATATPEVAISCTKTASGAEAEGRKDGYDEHIIREIVKDYGQVERLTPFRIKQILKAALRETKPPHPDPSVSTSFTICYIYVFAEAQFLHTIVFRNAVDAHVRHA